MFERYQVPLNPRLSGLTPSATVAINERSDRMLADGRDVIKLGLGQSPFPVPGLVVDALCDHAHEKDYLPVAGLLPLRESVARHTSARIGSIRVSPDQVMVAPGSKELIFLAQLVFSGRILVPNPSWVSYVPQAQILGRPVQYVETQEANDWMITSEGLRQACRAQDGPALLILNYPSNPTGASFSADALAQLAEVCAEEGVVVISDEIYGLVHHGAAHRSLAEFYPEGTIVSGGLSKWCGAGGWRLGTFVFPEHLEWMRKAMCVAASETYTSVSAPIQFAAIRAFEPSAEVDDYLDASRAVLRTVGQYCAKKLRAADVTMPEPVGGFYLFANFERHRATLAARGIADSISMCERILEDAGVAFLPGAVFGRPGTELTARLAYVDFDGSAALVAHSQREPRDSFCEQYCPRVVDAMQRIADWLVG